MYPNTIEFSQQVKPNTQPIVSISRIISLFVIIISVLFLAVGQLKAGELPLVQIDKNYTSNNNLDQLRTSLQKSLLRDGLITQETDHAIIIFEHRSMSVNGQVLSMSSLHNYSSILEAFGLDVGPKRQIIINDQSLIIGFNENGNFIVESIHGSLNMEL